ncbi:MAG: restriction endonuclease subunit S [Anabaena sp. CoA2_C59]|jgi:type I restriction enzyme S subunit|nr:restriction endonuclease subunit S [Anabaena sp. CoA2_C59]MDJ0507473.1 restriction endonuclease subunit S [Nostocales cyanobacterium LE14-WE12]
MSEWTRKTIAECADNEPYSTQIGPFGKALTPEEYTLSGVPLLRGVNVNHGRFYDDGFVFISEETANRLYKYESYPGDVLLVHKGTLGQIGLMPKKRKYHRYIMGNSMLRVKCDEKKLMPEYLYYWLCSREGQHYLLSRVSQVGVPQIQKPLATLREASLLVPSLNEQKAITHILETIDNKIENLGRQNETLEQIAQTLFKHWFIDFEFPNADGKPYKSSGGAMSPSELGDIPEGWRVEILKNIMTLNYGKSLTAENRINGKYPVVGSNGIVDTHTDFFVKGPGIVIGRKGTIGKVIWIEENFYPIDTTFYIEDNLGCEGLYFHYFLLKNQKFNKLTSDSAVPGLNRDMAYSVEFAISSNALINQYNSIAKTIFHKINNNEKQIQTLTKTRDALLPKLMSGQLRVKE